jgi:hypothetical protein
MTALTAAAYPPKPLGKPLAIPPYGGGLDDRHGETARFEFQLVCGLGAHPGDDRVRAALHLYLCHHLTLSHAYRAR